MFSPLLEMGKKMNVADVHNLEYIIYKRDDEISSLVEAYNRMVRDLSDSTKQLAQAEAQGYRYAEFLENLGQRKPLGVKEGE